jgi:hypothetical protein
MGSVTSTPKLPKQQAPVIVTVPAAVATQAAPASASATAPAAADAADPAAIAKSREDNLLSRGRGVLGTVLTSLRCVLADTTPKTGARKTLLGE